MTSRIACMWLIAACAFSLAPVVHAGDAVRFNYQGRVLLNGTPMNGVGQVKISIVNSSGTVTLWSNDDSATSGGQPTASLPVTVSNGVFDLPVGDAVAGMHPISGALFNGRDDLRVRLWFNDGAHGFQMLSPDRAIPNAGLLGLKEATEDLKIYVDAATGNDAYSGLKPTRAKKTIQAAINMAPHRVRHDGSVGIEIAPGTYREEVDVYGISGASDAPFGIESTSLVTPSATIDPNVRITGSDDDETPLRDYGMRFFNCQGVAIRGILTDLCAVDGFYSIGSDIFLGSCKGKNNLVHGLDSESDARITFSDFWGMNNGSCGLFFHATSWIEINRGGARGNTADGIWLFANSHASFRYSGDYSNNGNDGIRVYEHSDVDFGPGYVGTIQNNTQFGVRIRYQSFAKDVATYNTVSGNGSGSYEQLYGGDIYP